MGGLSEKPKFVREEVRGAEFLKEIHRANVVEKKQGWQATLVGLQAGDGKPGEETMPLRVTKELAYADVPEGVEITDLTEEQEGKKPLRAAE
jgi:hypothetical protein